MEAYYLLIVAILILLAASDLVVGVSNDAVNFLNSAVGSKAAPFKIIMIIAAAGILFGATFSSGMMEVARKGIFHPQEFFFSEIIIIFLAVMMTDIILLDVFNTFALPTSTTVSIVFELLGAAVAMALIKIKVDGSGHEMSAFINSSSALTIISGILLSVIVAFTVGALVQLIVRVIFSYNYEKTIRYYGALWGGIAITAITFFILIKGAKGSSFISAESANWIKSHTMQILLVSFAGWTLLLLLAQFIIRLNILKMIVLVGTFALAMAFAGNDLVNFIGVPLAGLESFREYTASGIEPDAFSMEGLAAKVKTPTVFLLLAGAIMVLALWTSRKARSVTKTEINLGRQDEGYERFDSSSLARGIVRGFISINQSLEKFSPPGIKSFLQKRMNQSEFKDANNNNGASFDLVRATVNLVVASILISFATSLKLPLSTTYVTFMVAMGTSLADGAWGRESAVYRVSGVITVVGGWFFTAFCAFSVAFLLVNLIHWGGIYAVVGLLGLIIFFFYKTFRLHRKRERIHEIKESELYKQQEAAEEERDVMRISHKIIYQTLSRIAILYSNALNSLVKLEVKSIKKTNRTIKELDKELQQIKHNTYQGIKTISDEDTDTAYHYIQVLDYLSEILNSLKFIAGPISVYIKNQHPELKKDQKSDIAEFSEEVNAYLSGVSQMIKSEEYKGLEKAEKTAQLLQDRIAKLRHTQLKRIKSGSTGTKSSTVFLNTIAESRSLIRYWYILAETQQDMIVNEEDAVEMS